MFVYCIYLGNNDVYFGSTTNSLNKRMAKHNHRLKQGICRSNLYNRARELGIKKLELVLLYEGENYKQIEHDLICNIKCLNRNGACPDDERKRRLHRERQKRYYYRKKNQIKNLI